MPVKRTPKGFTVVTITAPSGRWTLNTQHQLTPALAGWVLRSRSGALVGEVRQGGTCYQFGGVATLKAA